MPHKPFIRTLRAQWLGQQLRELREQRGMTLKLVSEHLQRDMSALGRYERAEWPIRRGDVVALLDLYGFHEAGERDRLLRLAEEVWRTDRWDEDYGDVVDASFIDFPWLESKAEQVCSYHAMLVPGLFQLREYAELVIRCVEGPKATEEKVLRWVDLRMQRQHVLDDRSNTKVESIIDESALRRQVGSATVMRAQLDHIVQLMQHPNVQVRVLPSRVVLHPGVDGSFWLFKMPEPYPAVGYLENLAGQLYVESPKSKRFVDTYDRLREAALDPRESAKLIGTIAEELQ
ncbi:Helix-turn-helix domain-containing protein [Micromonospora pattaloongensis]|uniref:Helix-turn-helix domain-containing protein n=1 Tax=Micromonospora pattaloongensis TaxID=405436 RepID=A0A1H3QW04_9ACTN|nr:helix-turn-helix transcriptional regulator [Micromonospora pattaloongensis]SDZ17520.1 Helix-turn-helix domain-containing protein [Micromonospora pattaloongensis]